MANGWLVKPYPGLVDEYEIVGADDEHIADVRDTRQRADLIAAAPAMYEALTAWLRVHDEGMQNREAAAAVWRSGRLVQAVDAARAALAAATGGTTDV